ncbi:methylmalonyl-CoA epimerase [bacterium]|nr:methylmalonyl-CoA epimerase [bacterium]
MNLKKISHIGIATDNLKKTAKLYQETLGLEHLGTEVVEEQKVKIAMFRIGEVKIELLEPTSPDSPIQKFLDARGPGFHHLAFETDDTANAIKEMNEKDIRMIDQTPRKGAGGCEIAFVHPLATLGVLIEFCSHKK